MGGLNMLWLPAALLRVSPYLLGVLITFGRISSAMAGKDDVRLV
jgi:hypothetical protein